MKKKIMLLPFVLLLFTLIGCGVSQEEYDTLLNKYNSLQSEYQNLEASNLSLESKISNLEKELENLNANESAPANEDTALDDTITSSNETASSYNDMSNGPSELELMSYAQTVLDNNLPDCEYSRNKDEYTFVKTNLRYKIEGKVARTKNDSSEDFYMIIEFIDDKYTTYDLLSLQVGDEIIYKSSSNGITAPADAGDNDILSEENTRIYNEVIDKLNADYSREEDEILEEIAPDYGMTAEELKEFMWSYMEAYYQ